MSAGWEVVVGLVIVIGLVGIVLPLLPGTILIAAAIGVWAIVTGGWAWAVFGAAAAVLAIGAVAKYLFAGRRLKAGGIGNPAIVVGGILGIVGFFVVPVIGLFLGFILGAFLVQWLRTRDARRAVADAWTVTKAAALTIGIELLAGLVAAATWLTAATAWL